MPDRSLNRYVQLITRVFRDRHTPGAAEVEFEREDIERTAEVLGIRLPKNLGDVVYSFRYRVVLPKDVQDQVPPGHEWIIRPVGRGRYRFVAVRKSR